MKRLYPRPQLQRCEWINLNGEWNFAFDNENIGLKKRWYKTPDFDKKIVVPFPYQSQYSKINIQDPCDVVWYHRNFNVRRDKSVILHFAAVDYEAQIYVNGIYVGNHIGGSNSFSFDITPYLVEGEQSLVVRAYDPSFNSYISRGKQTWKLEPFEVFYHRTTGIWQTVWLECVDKHYVTRIKTTPNFDNNDFQIELFANTCQEKEVEINVTYEDKQVATTRGFLQDRNIFNLKIEKEIHHWTPETPHLYDIYVKILVKGKVVDEFKSYSALRKFSIEGNKILLNNKPYYLRLVLDQGYFREGLLTYTSEETLLRDITLAKKMGFNGVRKHQKIEAERFLYYADKEGFLVSLEMPSAYKYSFSKDFINEWIKAIERDYNYVSLFMYVPINESWGVRAIKDRKDIQNYVNALYYLTKAHDPSRITVTNDGWEQTVTEVCTIHTYRHGKIDDLITQAEYKKSLLNLDTLLSSIHTNGNKSIYVGDYKYHGEPIILSEFGGISFANKRQDGWGYTGVETQEDYKKELERIFDIVYESKLFAGFCYTQITDVEQEINGLLDYDRNPKLSLDIIKKIVKRDK